MSTGSDPVEFDWGNQPEEPQRRQASRYMPRMMIAASVLVMVALIALAIAPAVLLFRGEPPGKDREDAIRQGTRHVAQLSAALYRETAEFRGYLLTGRISSLQRAVDARTEELRILAEMDTCIITLGPVARQQLAELRGAVQQWHQLPDSVAGGLMTPADYRAKDVQQTARRDSAFTALAALETEIDRIAVAHLEKRRVYAAQLRAFSIGLGAIALAAAVVVGWFLLRQRALAMGLERAALNEQRLRKIAETRREQLERVSESRQRLMRGFSHDVKNPLGAADGYLQLMEQGLAGPLNEQQQFKVLKVRNSIHSALGLIDDLLELAKAERGEIEISRALVDLRLLLDEVFHDYRDLATTKQLLFTIELPAEPMMIETDPNRVRQILGNLVSNAIKYTSHGFVRLSAGWQQADTGEVQARITVVDSGPGIPAERTEDIFQEFTRLEPGFAQGAGVGLAISRRLARALGGDIVLQSEVGQGSTFTLLLPADYPVEGGQPARAA